MLPISRCFGQKLCLIAIEMRSCVTAFTIHDKSRTKRLENFGKVVILNAFKLVNLVSFVLQIMKLININDLLYI